MNYFLISAGCLNGLAALIHLGCIYFGAQWYRFFGAGEHMATMAEQGKLQPTLITLFIALVLSVWSLYAFSAAGAIGRLPLLRIGLILITSIYILRGVVGFYFITQPMGRSPEFWIWSSIICLCIGIIQLIGIKQQWASL